MTKILIGALLMATATLAQTTPKTAKNTTTKPSSSSHTQPTRPLPNPSMKAKLESGDNANPEYRKQKAAGETRGVKNRFTPRRTASGARKDTLDKQRH